MSDLTEDERAELRFLHSRERDGKTRDRLKAVLLRDKGWTYEAIAEALLLDSQTISSYIKDYREDGKLGAEYQGSQSHLDEIKTKKLMGLLKQKLFQKASEICAYVAEHFSVHYSVSGMTAWFQAHGFVYKKAKGIPAKLDEKAQGDFVSSYEKLKEELPQDEMILFMDSSHPTQQTRLAYGWILKGESHYIPTTAGRHRVNVMAAVDPRTGDVVARTYERIHGGALISFLEQLQTRYRTMKKIHVIMDCAAYHRSEAVRDYLKEEHVKIHIHYLPAYRPNLNPSERLWHVMHQHVSHNRYHPTKQSFVDAVQRFLTSDLPNLKDTIRKVCHDRFQTISKI